VADLAKVTRNPVVKMKSFFFLPGSGASSSSAATDSSTVDPGPNCHFSAEPSGRVIAYVAAAAP